MAATIPYSKHISTGSRRGKDNTHANIELNGTPEDEHGGVAITKLDPINLGISHDGTDRREQT
jgi:hypothetical protein